MTRYEDIMEPEEERIRREFRSAGIADQSLKMIKQILNLLKTHEE